MLLCGVILIIMSHYYPPEHSGAKTPTNNPIPGNDTISEIVPGEDADISETPTQEDMSDHQSVVGELLVVEETISFGAPT